MRAQVLSTPPAQPAGPEPTEDLIHPYPTPALLDPALALTTPFPLGSFLLLQLLREKPTAPILSCCARAGFFCAQVVVARAHLPTLAARTAGPQARWLASSSAGSEERQG